MGTLASTLPMEGKSPVEDLRKCFPGVPPDSLSSEVLQRVLDNMPAPPPGVDIFQPTEWLECRPRVKFEKVVEVFGWSGTSAPISFWVSFFAGWTTKKPLPTHADLKLHLKMPHLRYPRHSPADGVRMLRSIGGTFKCWVQGNGCCIALSLVLPALLSACKNFLKFSLKRWFPTHCARINRSHIYMFRSGIIRHWRSSCYCLCWCPTPGIARKYSSPLGVCVRGLYWSLLGAVPWTGGRNCQVHFLDQGQLVLLFVRISSDPKCSGRAGSMVMESIQVNSSRQCGFVHGVQNSSSQRNFRQLSPHGLLQCMLT